MIKHIDKDYDATIEGFAYTNQDGDIEEVVYDWDMVTIRYGCEDGGSCSEIYINDIPKLIKALQAAYDYRQGK